MDLTQVALLVGVLAFTAWVVISQLKDRARHSTRLHGGISKEDRRFLRQAASVAAADVMLSQLAMRASTTASVQYMAKRIVDDHTQVNRKLASLAWRYRVHVSAEPGPEIHQRARQLRALRGNAFDRAYDEAIMQDYRKALDLFEAATHSGNPEIRQLAQTTLPTLDLHLKMAKELDPRTGSPLPLM